MKRKLLVLMISGLGGVLLLEGGLRLFLGLGDPVVLQADPEIGYLFQPNQAKHRFGNAVYYNQYSQRSDALQEPKPQFRVLMTGDSVLNGGNLTDQAVTIAEQLETQLLAAGTTAEVLNASAGSWGIGNQWAYLQRFGAFESDLLILQIGTHDLVQPTSTGEKIGQDLNFPDRAPKCALQEVSTRYLWPKLRLLQHRFFPSRTDPTPPPGTKDTAIDFQALFENNLAILSEIVDWAESQDLEVWVVYTPDRFDVLPPPEFADHQPFSKLAFTKWLRSRQVPLIDTHTAWQQLPSEIAQTYFRDPVHLTPAGNTAVAEQIADAIAEQ